MDKKRIYSELIKEYDRKRVEAHKSLETRKREIYEMLPRIKELDDQIAAAGFAVAFSSLESPETAKKNAGEYKKNCEKLLKEKYAILKQNSIPRKYLEIHYECEMCGDTGYINGKECACFRQNRVNLARTAYGASEMNERFDIETFDHFDFRYYSSKKPENKPYSPKKNMEKIVKYCLDYTKNFEAKKSNLLFYGKPGLGKTFLCNSIARELIDKGYIVVYITAFSLFKLLNDAQFGKIEDDDALLSDITASDLLIIDDIGTEFSTILTGTGFFNALNARSLSGRPVIISTNLDPGEIKELYSERIYSRIIGDYTLLEFYGEDIRPLKKYGKHME